MSETLLDEIRATKPAAPDRPARARPRAGRRRSPPGRPFSPASLARRPQWKRLVLVAPAALVVAVIAGGVIGLTATTSSTAAATTAVASGGAPRTAARTRRGAAERRRTRARRLKGAGGAARESATPTAGAAIAPAPGQLQRFEAELRLRVDDVEALSTATKQAQQIALRHGGSVASLQYDAPAEGVGGAQITLRVPTARVQSAMSQLSQLGTIVGQRYGIEDLQVQADSLQTQIEQTQRRIAQILTQLESSTLSDENRVVLQSRLNASRQKLTGLREAMRATNAEARTATIYLTLTTEEIQPEAVGRQPPRRRQGRARLGGDRAALRPRRRRPVRPARDPGLARPPPPAQAGRDPAARAELGRVASGARPARSCPGRARSRRGAGRPAPPPGRTALGGPIPCRRPHRRRRRRRPRPRAGRRRARGRPGPGSPRRTWRRSRATPRPRRTRPPRSPPAAAPAAGR